MAGLGAVKYADLYTSRTKDYVFDVDRMVSFNGNTGGYLQYAHARIRSILRRLPEEMLASARFGTEVALEPAERGLGLALDELDWHLRTVADTLEPHRLCGYLYGVARAFTDFYETCPVMRAPTAERRDNRVALCRLTAATLAQALDLLGIDAPERI